MARSAEGTLLSTAEATVLTHPPASPAASRLRGRRWRDWRLLLGIVLVLGSAVAGAWLLASAQQTVPTWAAASDLNPGQVLRPDDVTALPARVESATNPYLTGPIPDGYVVVRPVDADELVPASALAPASEVDTDTRHVAVAVPTETLPGSLSAGDRVDVWVVPDTVADAVGDTVTDTPAGRPATLLAEGVAVASAAQDDTGLAGTAATTSVVLSLSDDATPRRSSQDTLATMVAASAAGRVVLTLDPSPR